MTNKHVYPFLFGGYDLGPEDYLGLSAIRDE